jgi:hypothetical protein
VEVDIVYSPYGNLKIKHTLAVSIDVAARGRFYFEITLYQHNHHSLLDRLAEGLTLLSDGFINCAIRYPEPVHHRRVFPH